MTYCEIVGEKHCAELGNVSVFSRFGIIRSPRLLTTDTFFERSTQQSLGFERVRWDMTISMVLVGD